MVRWLWKDIPGGDIPDHVNHLIHSWALWFCSPYRYIADVLMSLIHFESNRTGRLDLAFSVLHDLIRTNNTFDCNFLSLATGLVNLIATHSHRTHGHLSREQAKSLVSLYDRIETLENPRIYSLRGHKAEVEKKELLDLLRTFWMYLYPDGKYLSSLPLLRGIDEVTSFQDPLDPEGNCYYTPTTFRKTLGTLCDIWIRGITEIASRGGAEGLFFTNTVVSHVIIEYKFSAVSKGHESTLVHRSFSELLQGSSTDFFNGTKNRSKIWLFIAIPTCMVYSAPVALLSGVRLISLVE